MGQKSRADLKTENNANITTNNNNEITGAKHNTLNENSYDSHYNKIDDNTEVSLYDYVSSRSYVIGQGVYYSSILYRCTTNTTGTFNPAHWTVATTTSKDEFSFTDSNIGTKMTNISGFIYQRTHNLNTNTPKIVMKRPSGLFFDVYKDLAAEVIDVNTIQFDFGFAIDVGTTYVLIEK